MGKDKYSDTPKTTAQVYTDLNHRHWDYFNEGKYNHVFVVNTSDKVEAAKDLWKEKHGILLKDLSVEQKILSGARILHSFYM
jgi:hypothetical protein